MYQSTWESLNQHKVPKWFMDAKFGIFIHWGPYSVPAWAPSYDKKGKYYNELVGYHPYAELYGYGMLYKDTPVWKYHVEKYGAAFQYEDFFPQFKAEKWDPKKWAQLFKKVGAKYVVLVTKHSDGYSMWDTKFTDRNSFLTGPKRDITGELTEAVKNEGLEMGLYYSLTFNWYYRNFPHLPYREFSHNQLKELIDKYKPSLLWSDDYWKPNEKSYAAQWQSKEILSYFYNQADDPDLVLVNDRWGQEENGLQLGDFSTPEYSTMTDITDFYWEHTRGIGSSFGYNQNETDKDYLSVSQLVTLLVDIVSKNGNFLLNVGPKSDGTLDQLQQERLIGIGNWLEINGEAIYETRPWISPEGKTADDLEVRFTTKDNYVNAIILGEPQKEVTIKNIQVQEGSTIKVLGSDQEIEWSQDLNGVHLNLPEQFQASHAYTVQISPEPFMLLQKRKNSHEEKYAEIWRKGGYIKVDI